MLHFNIRVIRPGDRYGLNDCLMLRAGEQPLVEFYDPRYLHTPFGQFVARYYLSTIRTHGGPLCLDGGVPEWTLTADQVAAVQHTLYAMRGL